MGSKINGIYLKPKNILEIKRIFRANRSLPSAKLERFFDASFYGKLRKEALNAKYRKVRDPMHFSYSEAKTPKILDDFLCLGEFRNFCSKITGKKIKKIKGSLQSFGWKDYTLLHDEKIDKPAFDIIIDFTDSWNANARGFLVYVDANGTHNKLVSIGTILTIVQRKKNAQKFVQYVNHLAGKKRRYFFIGKF